MVGRESPSVCVFYFLFFECALKIIRGNGVKGLLVHLRVSVMATGILSSLIMNTLI